MMDENQSATTDSTGAPAGDAKADDLGTTATDLKKSVQDQSSTAPTVDWQAKYRDLEKDYTRKSQKLSRLEREAQVSTVQSKPEVKISPEEFWGDPVTGTERVVEKVLSGFEARQQQQRQLEKYLDQWATDNQIPVREMQNLYQQVVEASSNPDDLMQLLVDVHRARNASTEIQRAQQVMEETARKNARAVTSQGGSTQTDAGGFSIEEFKTWPREKREAYLRQTVGVKEDW